jgi:hypothetical protein
LLFGRNYLLFPTCEFRCYSVAIPLLFHCSQNQRFGSKPLKLLARPHAIAPGFEKNSLLIPLLPQIAKRFQSGAAGREAVASRIEARAPDASPPLDVRILFRRVS